MTNKRNSCILIGTVVACCIIMAFIEIIIEPTYIIKSTIKIIAFLLLPLIAVKVLNMKAKNDFFSASKDKIIKALLLGAVIFSVIIIGYIVSKAFFDYSSLINSLSTDQKAGKESFIWIAMYIVFCNSFLEEFIFRYISFVKLSENIPKKIAYLFSSIMFACYHIFIIESSFPTPLLLLSLLGLFLGGLVFDYIDEKDKSIYNSWIIHMFADLAIMTIWFINI